MSQMDDKNLLETKVSSKQLYDGRVVRLFQDQVTLPDGRPAMREVIRHPGGVGILPLREDGMVYVVRQCRYPYAQVITEIPAGKLEYGEDPLACGKRELMEEVGAEASNWVFLGNIYPTPAYDDEIIRIYLATGLTFSQQHLDDGEFLELDTVPFQQLVEQVMAGEICDAKTQIAVLKTQHLLDQGLQF